MSENIIQNTTQNINPIILTNTEPQSLTIVRGDNVIIQLVIRTSTGELYIPTSNDKVIFSLSNNPTKQYSRINNKLLFKKEFDSTQKLNIIPDDTRYLDLDTYYYNIQLIKEDQTIETVSFGSVYIVY